jgi:ribosomal protein S24E
MVRLNILEDRRNELVHRRELRFDVIHEGGGSIPREEVRKALSEKLGIAPEKLLVVNLKTLSGTNTTVGEAFIFNGDVEERIIEPRIRWKLRKGGGEEKAQKSQG